MTMLYTDLTKCLGKLTYTVPRSCLCTSEVPKFILKIRRAGTDCYTHEFSHDELDGDTVTFNLDAPIRKLAQEIADKTSRNLFSAILRKAYLLRDAILDPSSPAAQEIGENLFKGATAAAGMLAVNAVVLAGSHSFPYFEFVATPPALIKEYFLVAFQNNQMLEIIDALEFEYLRIRKLLQQPSKTE